VNAVEEIEECVRIAAGEPKDLAALHTDYQLGIELAQKLKAVNKSTAVLLIANYIPGNDHAAAIDDLLPKPMDIETVESKAEEILEGRARCVRSALQ
jgi:response regulator RpfG family c-di-GMP phosphodiesterase